MEDNEAKKLTIEERKIIHILLKHLMEQRNEIAYLKNKVGLNNYGNGNSHKDLGINIDDNSNSHKDIGINVDDNSNSLEGIGINIDDNSNSLEGIGINIDDNSNSLEGIGINIDDNSNSLEGIGINIDDNSNSGKDIGINIDDNSNSGKDIGINHNVYSNSGKGIAINGVDEVLSAMERTSNDADWLYSVFEQGLNDALDDYIRNGNGEATLYTFYSDFEEAIADKNSLADKLKQAKTNLQLEDTHILPAQIPADAASLSKLQASLYKHLPHNSKQDLHENVALELLFLHNTGTSKQTPLRKLTGISVSGFSKHLPKLKHYGLLKGLPSKNYALTDKSNHILLEIFGIPKTL